MSKKESTGPSLMGAVLIGLLTFCIGGLFGTISLITQPVTMIAKPLDPEKIIPGRVYFLKGQTIGRTAWRAKEDAWRAGMVDVLRLSESELNEWSRERLKIEVPATKEAASQVVETVQFIPSQVNFRVFENSLQLSTEIEFGGYLADKQFVYQVTGSFEDTAKGFRFVPKAGNIGSAPLGFIPIVRTVLFNLVRKRLANATDTDWLGESFKNMESIEVVDNQLVMRRKAES